MHRIQASTPAFVLAILLCWTATCTTTARHILQDAGAPAPAASTSPAPANATELKPAATSQVFTQLKAESLMKDGNFTFLPGYTTKTTGELGKLGYNIQLVNSSTGSNISAWHEIPLDLQVGQDGSITLNTLVEIPTGEQAKYETMTTKPGNPIQQDTNEVTDDKGNVLQEVPRYYMYGPSLGNYGGLPQTWSNSNKTDETTGYVGDNDPLDVLDISSIRAPIGGVYRVKVLGVLGMIDSNETDWKIIAINTNDPQANNYNSVQDVPKERLGDILQFYANYKQAEGKPNACFWPVQVSSSSPATAPVCKIPADADPSQYFHNKEQALQVIKRYQDNYRWLLAGNCKSEACADLWWLNKSGDSSEASTAASPQATSG